MNELLDAISGGSAFRALERSLADPAARAEAARASLTVPMPPARIAAPPPPSASPERRCSSESTELFERGPRFAPITASIASAPFSSGDSKFSSSTS